MEAKSRPLGYPKAALFAFCVARIAYNVYATLKASLRAVHGEEKVREEVSGFQIAADVALDHPGMNVAFPNEMWGALPKHDRKAIRRLAYQGQEGGHEGHHEGEAWAEKAETPQKKS